MAEAIAKKELKNSLFESAGTRPEPVNPHAIQVLKDIDIDISNNISKKVDLENINNYDLVITLCGDARDNCPFIKPPINHIHWNIEDPAKFRGTNSEINLKFSEVRDIIAKHINLFKEEL